VEYLVFHKNKRHAVIGTDHDTFGFEVNFIYGCWKLHGKKLYQNATQIYITADSFWQQWITPAFMEILFVSPGKKNLIKYFCIPFSSRNFNYEKKMIM
jgi:hypothetical protein